MKKRFYAYVVGLMATLAFVPVQGMPLGMKLFDAGSGFTQNILSRPQVELRLVAEQKQTQKDTQGKDIVSWKELKGNVTVQPGDVLRYAVMANNKGNAPAQDLAIVQPIPRGTVYVLNSAAAADEGSIVLNYSIDGGKTYSANPMITVKMANGQVMEIPAPAEAYSHIQVKFNRQLAKGEVARATYQVAVR